MGRDKLGLEVDGTPLLGRVVDALSPRCSEIVVVGGGGAPIEGVRQVLDERPGREGPLSGMEAGLAAVEHPLVFVAAGDMPFLPPALISYLLERLEAGGASAVVPRHRGRVHPLCAAYAREAAASAGPALDRGVRAVQAFLKGLDAVAYVEAELRRFGDPDLFLMNVNSPEDLERARAVL